MTQKEKELLLSDLCARLPYGVACAYFNTKDEIKVGELRTVWCKEKRIFIDNLSIDYDGCDCIGVIPYLFPLSSMTEKQKEELFFNYIHNDIYYDDFTDYFLAGELWHDITVSMDILPELIIWLLKNHFDIYDLIPKGLAIDATGLGIY